MDFPGVRNIEFLDPLEAETLFPDAMSTRWKEYHKCNNELYAISAADDPVLFWMNYTQDFDDGIRRLNSCAYWDGHEWLPSTQRGLHRETF